MEKKTLLVYTLRVFRNTLKGEYGFQLVCIDIATLNESHRLESVKDGIFDLVRRDKVPSGGQIVLATNNVLALSLLLTSMGALVVYLDLGKMAQQRRRRQEEEEVHQVHLEGQGDLVEEGDLVAVAQEVVPEQQGEAL